MVVVVRSKHGNCPTVLHSTVTLTSNSDNVGA